jgi:phage gpG-like protein
MAEAFTSYSVDNDKRFRNALKAASESIDDFRIPFGSILRDFYRSQQAIWKLQGPGKYPPFQSKNMKEGQNKTPYQLQKIRKYGFDYPLLVASGRLAASLSGPNNPGSVAVISRLSLIFGSSVAYGMYHQSDEPRKKIPLRKFLFIGPEAPRFATSDQVGRLQRWIGYINDHVANVAIKNGLASRFNPRK